MSFATGLKSLEGISDRLAWFQRLGNWKNMLDYPDKIMTIKAEDIPEITKKYLKTDCKTVGLLLQKTEQKAQENEKTPSSSNAKGR